MWVYRRTLKWSFGSILENSILFIDFSIKMAFLSKVVLRWAEATLSQLLVTQSSAEYVSQIFTNLEVFPLYLTVGVHHEFLNHFPFTVST